MQKFYVLFLVALSTIIMMSCGESAENYNKRVNVFADSLNSNMELASGVASMRSVAWSNAIYNHFYKNPLTDEYKTETSAWGKFNKTVDFNEALMYFNQDMDAVFTKLKSNKKIVDSLYSTFKNPPSKSEKAFELLKGMYSNYTSCFNLALSGDGFSYQSFSNEVGKSESMFRKHKTDLSIELK